VPSLWNPVQETCRMQLHDLIIKRVSEAEKVLLHLLGAADQVLELLPFPEDWSVWQFMKHHRQSPLTLRFIKHYCFC
jgi:hypothetical protein